MWKKYLPLTKKVNFVGVVPMCLNISPSGQQSSNMIDMKGWQTKSAGGKRNRTELWRMNISNYEIVCIMRWCQGSNSNRVYKNLRNSVIVKSRCCNHLLLLRDSRGTTYSFCFARWAWIAAILAPNHHLSISQSCSWFSSEDLWTHANTTKL